MLSNTTETVVTEPIRISPSRLNVFLECPKKFHLVYVEGLRRKEQSPIHFDVGNYIHELLHVYYQTIQASPGIDRATLSAMIQARIRNDVQVNKPPASQLAVYNKVRKHLTRFIEKQSPIIDRGIRVQQVEYEFDVPITLPSGRQVNLFGFMDLVYRTMRGKLVVRDHKSTSNPRTFSEEGTKFDQQLLMYGAVMFLLTGEAPIVEFNIINTYEYKKEPTQNEFRLLAATHTDKVYQRYLEETSHLIDAMLDSKPTPHYSRGCSGCPFKDLCEMELKGSSVVRLKEANYERVDPNQPKRSITFTENNSTLNPPNL